MELHVVRNGVNLSNTFHSKLIRNMTCFFVFFFFFALIVK